MKVGKTPMPRRAPQQRRSEATVAAILEAAERVIVREGRKALTTKRVARVAGVSVGSVYQFYPSKEALVIALERQGFSKVLESFQEAIVRAAVKAAAGEPIEGVVHELVESMVLLFADRFRVHGLASFNDLPEALQVERRAALDVAVEVIAAALEPYGTQIGPQNRKLAAALTIHGVITLTELGLAYHAEEMSSGEAPREIARMMSRYLVRGDAF